MSKTEQELIELAEKIKNSETTLLQWKLELEELKTTVEVTRAKIANDVNDDNEQSKLNPDTKKGLYPNADARNTETMSRLGRSEEYVRASERLCKLKTDIDVLEIESKHNSRVLRIYLAFVGGEK